MSPIPSELKPILKAYIFAHFSTTAPRLFTLLAPLVKKKSNKHAVVARAVLAFRRSFELHRFPAFIAILIASGNVLENVFISLLKSLQDTFRGRGVSQSKTLRLRLARCLAGFAAAWYSLGLLNDVNKGEEKIRVTNLENLPLTDPSAFDPTHKHAASSQKYIRSSEFAGKTLDLTILTCVQAFDALVGSTWRHYRSSRKGTTNTLRHKAEELISKFADSATFIGSCYIIMWAFIYLPERLPKSYRRWIDNAAQADPRLIEALNRVRDRTMRYGFPDHKEVFGKIARDLGRPEWWGDPSKVDKLPCELVHGGRGASCHLNFVKRIAEGFKFAFAMYLPLNLLVRIRNPSLATFIRAIKEASRSSLFLGTFIGLWYYGTCLARNLIGPNIIPRSYVTQQMWDGGLSSSASCLLCGFSIFIEPARRRVVLALFVLSRAVSTLLPRRYPIMQFWKERMAFSLSAGVLLAYIRENPKALRGMLGPLLYSTVGGGKA